MLKSGLKQHKTFFLYPATDSLQLTHRSKYGRMLMMGNNLLTMWKGERGGGRGTFLGGGQALAPVLGLDLVVTGV